ncbi:MAG TPA: alpha/beta hydrolase, partial [Pseudohongiella sp.]|nr:alpha/beta hydrolase [Pseudohongiella sp.]
MQGAETGPDVIFIPGLTSHWTTFEDVCAALEHRYRCHMLQLPGFAGFEPMQNFDNGFMHPLREQVISYISTLPQPVTLVGHSLGGTLSMDIAAARPGLVRQLVLIDSL